MMEARKQDTIAPERFETKRLEARRVGPQDRAYHVRLLTDRDVARMLGGLRTRLEVAEWHEGSQEHWAEHGYGEWLLFERASGEFIGRVMLNHTQFEHGEDVELAFALMPAHWRRGLTIEAAEAVLEIAFGQIGLDSVLCTTLETNYASLRVIERLGFEFSHNAKREGVPHVFYRINRTG